MFDNPPLKEAFRPRPRWNLAELITKMLSLLHLRSALASLLINWFRLNRDLEQGVPPR